MLLHAPSNVWGCFELCSGMARVGLCGGKLFTFSSGSHEGQKAEFTLGHPPQSRQDKQGFPVRKKQPGGCVCVVQECKTLSRKLLSLEKTPEPRTWRNTSTVSPRALSCQSSRREGSLDSGSRNHLSQLNFPLTV